jgi:hypothetical protein
VDFNVRPGNTLVGFARLDDVKRSLERKHSATETIKAMPGFEESDQVKCIIEEAEIVDRAFRKFHEMQTQQRMDGRSFFAAKQELRQRLSTLVQQLDRFLAGEYGIDTDKKPKEFAKWQVSHEPFHWFAEFFGIMTRGGFDAIVGNPPYVEYAKVRDLYVVRGYGTSPCGNLYAYVLERSKALASANGRLGLIVPLSLVCTDRMRNARSLLRSGTTWLPSFDIRPSSLFEGVAQRLTIIVQNMAEEAEAAVYTGGYRRWTTGERENLLALTQYVRTQWTGEESPVAKIAQPIEATILQKVNGRRLAEFVSESQKHIYIHRICRYFIKALDFVPFFRDAEGNKGRSEDYKPFSFPSEQRDAILCFIDSTLFYWFWRAHGDGFHCGYGDVYRTPWFSDLSLPDRQRFSGLAERLMEALKANSARKTIRTNRGEIIYQEFAATPTKPILDEIDMLLASEYHLTADELDFVINYDIKYRMGPDGEEEDE